MSPSELTRWEKDLVDHLNADRKPFVRSVRYRPHYKLFADVTEGARSEAPELARRLAGILEERFGSDEECRGMVPRVVVSTGGEVLCRYPPRTMSTTPPPPDE